MKAGRGNAPTFASGVLDFNGNASNLDVITIGATVYRYVTVLALAYDILIGGTASQTILNSIAAVNAGAGEGTVYGSGTLIHPTVTASSAPGDMIATAKVAGASGNLIATLSTSLTATWGAATLQGGTG